MSEPDEYDLIVIGSGPADEKAAVHAAYHGFKVAKAEKAPVLGGAALNTGTIPSKTLKETALYVLSRAIRRTNRKRESPGRMPPLRMPTTPVRAMPVRT